MVKCVRDAVIVEVVKRMKRHRDEPSEIWNHLGMVTHVDTTVESDLLLGHLREIIVALGKPSREAVNLSVRDGFPIEIHNRESRPVIMGDAGLLAELPDHRFVREFVRFNLAADAIKQTLLPRGFVLPYQHDEIVVVGECEAEAVGHRQAEFRD